MTLVWLLDCLCHRPGCVTVALCWSPRTNPFYSPQLRRLWFCRVGPYADVCAFSTSPRQESADLRRRSSRLRAALDSVRKTVSGTRAEILSRLKAVKMKSTPPLLLEAPPSAPQAPPSTYKAPPTSSQAPPPALAATPTKIREQECGVTEPQAPPSTHKAPPTAPHAPPSTHNAQPTAPHAPPSELAPKATMIQEQEHEGVETSPPTALQAPPSTYKAPPTALQAPPSTDKAPSTALQAPHSTHKVPPTARQAPPSCVSPAAKTQVHEAAPPTTPQAPPPTQTTPLFHPWSLSAHLGETYDSLSHHINSYFRGYTKPDQAVAPPASSPPETPPFSLANYITTSAPSVQAFVGNYISPLVPRFRSEARRVSTEANTADEASKSRDRSAEEERARRLQIQRDKV